MNWTEPLHSRGIVNRAGAALSDPGINLDFILGVVDNWRSAHSYPLHSLTANLRNRADAADQGAVVAQRLKRLGSITKKLERQPNMKLSQMQDIGGCRAVVTDMNCLNALVLRFEKGAAPCWSLCEKYDYVSRPKTDGYRSVHLVYQYASIERPAFNKLRIEIQIRSRLQHAWATALETVDTFTRQALKSHRGSPDWLRFFALMGHSIAIREGQSPVPGVPIMRRDLLREISELAVKLNVINTLHGWASAIEVTSARKNAHFFLLTLNMDEKRIYITPYSKNQSELAAAEYSLVEKQNAECPEIQSVLVSVNSFRQLRLAFPNYYLDTTAFTKLVEEDIQASASLDEWPAGLEAMS